MNGYPEPAPFRYQCRLCGQCCSGTMEVYLNPGDLHALGLFLRLSHTDELYRKGLIKDSPGQYRIPWPRLWFRGRPPRFCPFVENHWSESGGIKALCRLQNKAKPLICRLAPVTRTADLETGEEAFRLTPPVAGCPGFESSRPQTMEKYLLPLRRELSEEVRFFKILRKALDQGEKPEDLSRFFRFRLDRPWEEILQGWEKDKEIPRGKTP